MDNQSYNIFFNNFKENHNNDFSKIFLPDEELRLKMLKDFKKNAALLFIPAILLIVSIMAIMYMYSVSFFIGIFSIISVFLIIWIGYLFHNNYIVFLYFFLIPLMNIEFIGILVAIVLPIIICRKLFCNYKDKWNKKYTKLLKEKYRRNLVKSFGNIDWMENKYSIPIDYLKASDLFEDFDIIEIDDTFKGKYKDVPFNIAETKLYKNTDRGGVRGDGSRNGKAEVFTGLILNFKINKTVNNRTLVTTKKNKTAQHIPAFSYIALILLLYIIWNALGIFGKIAVIAFVLYYIYFELFENDISKRFQKVVLEDPKFNKIFNAYSSDQVEARYLLTTSFMERFKNLQSVFGAKVVKCSFYDENKLMIAISTNKNLFEIGSLFKSVYDKDFMKQFYKELSSIYFLIDYFKLDENIKI